MKKPNSSDLKTVSMKILPVDFWLYSNPMISLINMKGGKRAEAGQWTLEIQKLLNGIEKSVTALENLMNQDESNKKLYLDNQEIRVSEEEKSWMAIYVIDNSILRIYACLDKIAQMTRCYFEHDDNGGEIFLHRKCGCVEKMHEQNCTFGSLVSSLNAEKKITNKRNDTVITALNNLNKDASITELRKYRNTFTHKKHDLDQSVGLDPSVEVVDQNNGTIKTNFTFVQTIPSVNWFRIEIVKSNNAIVDYLQEVSDFIFPKNFEIKFRKSNENL